jgi:peptidoglycan/LPS O-acetylase OafA/YrhL
VENGDFAEIPMRISSPRYLFVDALRGVASVGVLLAHIVNNEISKTTLDRVLPIPIKELCFNGQFGVQIFFVLSGFVIALSLSQKPLTTPRAWNFALRRQLRLDPPYFVALFALMLLHVAFGRAFPDLKTLALNLTYLHNLANVPQILGVAWTLCLEIQFYLAFVVILALDRLFKARENAPFSMFAVHFVWITGLISCYLVQSGTPMQLYALGPFSWFYFAAGVLCFWCWRGWAPLWTFGALLLGMTGAALWSFTHEANFVSASFEGIEAAVVTALILFVAAGRGTLETWSLGRVGQFAGRVSYSLYLMHAFTVEALMWTTRALWGETIGAWSGFLLALPVCFAVAQIFYVLIEKPSVQWAARFKTDS